MTDKQWDTIIALHNTAPFKLVRAAAPYFRVKDGEPRNIINISSTSGVNGNAYVSFSTLLLCSALPCPALPYYIISNETIQEREEETSNRKRKRTCMTDSPTLPSGQANYGLAKAGIIGLSKVIAKVRRPYPPIQPYLTSIETPPKNSGLLKASLTPSQEWGPQFGVRANT